MTREHARQGHLQLIRWTVNWVKKSRINLCIKVHNVYFLVFTFCVVCAFKFTICILYWKILFTFYVNVTFPIYLFASSKFKRHATCHVTHGRYSRSIIFWTEYVWKKFIYGILKPKPSKLMHSEWRYRTIS